MCDRHTTAYKESLKTEVFPTRKSSVRSTLRQNLQAPATRVPFSYSLLHVLILLQLFPDLNPIALFTNFTSMELASVSDEEQRLTSPSRNIFIEVSIIRFDRKNYF